MTDDLMLFLLIIFVERWPLVSDVNILNLSSLSTDSVSTTLTLPRRCCDWFCSSPLRQLMMFPMLVQPLVQNPQLFTEVEFPTAATRNVLDQSSFPSPVVTHSENAVITVSV